MNGRDLTAQDVDAALHIDCPTNEQIADRLNRIARPDPEQCQYCPNDVSRTPGGYRHCIECGWTDDPAKIVDLCNKIDELEAELASRRSGIATAPPCTDGYWRNEKHPPPPSATGGENADPRES